MFLLSELGVLDEIIVEPGYNFFIALIMVAMIFEWTKDNDFDPIDLFSYIIGSMAICFMSGFYGEGWLLLISFGALCCFVGKYIITYGFPDLSLPSFGGENG